MEVHCELFQKQAFQHLSRPLSLSLCFSCAIGSRDPADKGSGMPERCSGYEEVLMFTDSSGLKPPETLQTELK